MNSKVLLASGLIAALASSASAQVSAYYTTEGTSSIGNTYVFQGGTEQFSYRWVHGGEMPIAVGDFGSGMAVRQAVGQPLSGGPEVGSEYTPAGVATGFTNTWTRTANGNTAYDAAFDGTNIYMVDWTGGEVYMYDNNYNGGTYLFNASASDIGITYDSGTGTLWTSNFSTGVVSNWSMTGTLLSSFNTAGSSAAGLAYDAADGTLWMSDGSGSTVIRQYSTAGALLQTVTTNHYILGGEMNAVPEPATLGLLALGAIAALRRKKA